MANTKKKAKEHPSGVDSWTSNGYGIVGGPVSAERKKAIDQINADLAAKKRQSGKQPTKKKK